jgi:hypothetical protein
MLTIASLLSILFMTFHFTDDMLRKGGMAKGGASNLGGVLILLVWLCGTLLLAERRSGHIIMLLGALFTAAMPVIHMAGARTAGTFFFIWCLYVLGMIGSFAAILAARGLWGLTWGRRRSAVPPSAP